MIRALLPLAAEEGDPPRAPALLWRELAPAPGRLGNALRITALVLVTVAVSETFRLPETALSAFLVLFLSKAERASTVRTALVSGAAVVVALLAAIVALMASLSEPALRLPLIAAMTFTAMFLARVSPLGPVLFAAGFIIAYGMTLGDEVLGLALQPGAVGNTTGPALPLLASMPPEEALVHFLLWLALAVALPAAVVIAGNLLTGRDPRLLLRGALAQRLDAAAGFCAGEPGAERALAALAQEGTGELVKLAGLSRLPRHRAADAVAVEAVARLCLALLAAARLPAAWVGSHVAAVAPALRAAATAARTGAALPEAPAPPLPGATGAARPLVAELSRALAAIRGTLAVPPGAGPAGPTAAKPARRLLAPDAWTNPDHARFALKVTLAMMLCYAVEDLTDWPGIHTCVITCFFVSLGSVGETVHKATLRLAGCAVGGALGIVAILLLMPLMTDLGDLLLVLAAVTFLAGWVASGGERTSYAGLQIGLAFFLTVLQGNGPTLDMETARDRLIGIALGDAVVSAVFVTIWPVGVAQVVRAALARALELIAEMLERPEPDAAAEAGSRQAFDATIAQARGVLGNDPYEALLLRRGAQRRVDRATLLDVQALLIPASALLGVRDDPAWQDVPAPARERVTAHHRALAAWLRRCAAWARGGAGAAEVVAGLPASPAAEALAVAGPASSCVAAWAWWCAVLNRDIRAILDRVGAPPRPAGEASAEGTAVAPT